MNKALGITLVVFIGVLTLGATSAFAQYCDDGTCDPGEFPSTCPADCPLTGCGDLVCAGGETPVTCATDCGICDCAPTTNGPLGSRCTSPFMNHGDAGIIGSCDQNGTCTADCNQGIVSFNSTCNAWQTCPGGTNGAGDTICTYPFTLHNESNIPGVCNNNGSCTVSCNDGVITVNNSCQPPLNNCSAGTSGSGESICTYPASTHGQVNVPGSCNEEGGCSVDCNDGVPTVTSTCNPFENCIAGTNGSGQSICTYPASNDGQTGIAGACNNDGSCSVGCTDGAVSVSNGCTPPAGAPALIAGCYIDTAAFDNVTANSCIKTLGCFSPCSTTVYYDVGNYFELGGYTLTNPLDWTFSWSGHSTCGTNASCITPIACQPHMPLHTSTLNWTHIPTGDSGSKTVTARCGTID